MAKNVDERIARIKQQREALAQRLNALEQKAASEARKRDTRRKIIVGGAIIAQMEKEGGFRCLRPHKSSRNLSGVKMTARPLPICSPPPPASPARRLLKTAAALLHLPRARTRPAWMRASRTHSEPLPDLNRRVPLPRPSSRAQRRKNRPPILSLPLSTISPACLDEKANRSAKARNFLMREALPLALSVTL